MVTFRTCRIPLLHIAALVVTLVAVLTMPICVDPSNAPILDADILTITESRDVVEIMTPGTHRLHSQVGVEEHCRSCGPFDQSSDAPLATHLDEQAQRTATMPDSMTTGASLGCAAPSFCLAQATSRVTGPLAPPPRTVS